MLKARPVLALAPTLLLFPGHSEACSCSGEPTIADLVQADIVFRGIPLETHQVTLSDEVTNTRAAGNRPRSFPAVDFQVVEAWKGVQFNRVTVIVGSGTSCDLHPDRLTEEVIVHGDKGKTGMIWSLWCNRPFPASVAPEVTELLGPSTSDLPPPEPMEAGNPE